MISSGWALPVLAKVELQIQGQPISKVPGLLLSDVLLIVSIGVGLLLVLLIWAKYLRNAKPKRRRRGGEKVFRGAEAEAEQEEEDSAEARRRYKYRYRRRDHRSRNPTLAETGGLPPTRTEGSAESPH